MSNDFGLYLGPLLGFLFTAGTLIFIALNAHKTANAELRAEPAPAAPETAPQTTTEAAPSEPEPRS